MTKRLPVAKVKGQSPTLAEFFASTYRLHRLALPHDGTISKYRAAINSAKTIVGREPRLDDLSDDLVARCVNASLAKGNSPSTANDVRAKLNALWCYAAKRRMVDDFPTLPKLKEYRRVPTAWTREQLAALFAACASTPGEIEGIPANRWWVNLHAVLWDSGARIGAVVAIQRGRKPKGLEWQHVDLAARALWLQAENQKQKADQAHRLHADTVAGLRYQVPKGRWVFPWPKCEATLYKSYRSVLERAGLPTTRRDKFHRMRRSVASWYEASGGNSTRLLGHSARKVTMNYLDPLITRTDHACDRLFRPSG